jgi:lipoate---protein ligase
MKYLDMTLSSPAENLACDEALLDFCEETGADDVLRFWEPREYFVVVGYANSVQREVNVAACAESNIPIFRRCTGGGTVLQGPGCLNYSLILNISHDPMLESIRDTNEFILQRNQAALQPLVGSAIQLCGQTDLAIGGKKFSGNSQRRRKKCLLFHGTFLLSFNLGLIEKFLLMPSMEPDYRDGRSHLEFVANLDFQPSAVKSALKEIWLAHESFNGVPLKIVSEMAANKYSTPEWNAKF